MSLVVADALRAWIAAARGALEWHVETGDVELPVPDGFRPPPLGRIASGDFTPRAADAAPGGGATRAGDAPRPPANFARLAEAAGAVVEQARRPATPAPAVEAPAPAAPEAPAPAAPEPAPVIEGDGPPAAAAQLRVIRDELGDCRRCPLAKGRTEIVFGAGHPRARLMFVADQPDLADDQVGLPFVDESGALLGRMVRAMGLDRSQVYLTHLVKCHDPEQGPEPGLDPCAGFIERQIAAVRPEIIIALGGVAARRLTGRTEQLPHLRGAWHDFRGTPVLATFHPNALRQHPESKRQVWSDLKSAMRKLGLPLPRSRGR